MFRRPPYTHSLDAARVAASRRPAKGTPRRSRCIPSGRILLRGAAIATATVMFLTGAYLLAAVAATLPPLHARVAAARASGHTGSGKEAAVTLVQRSPRTAPKRATPAPKPTRTPTPTPPTKPAPPAASPAVTPTAKPQPAPDLIRAYRGLGAWVDWYDYGHPDNPDPATIVNELVQGKVRTLYLQTGLWSQTPDIMFPGAVNAILDLAHARGIAVVAWYVPGFVDVNQDLKASLAAVNYSSPSGQHFDGFAPDIEDFTGLQQALRHTATISVPPHRGCWRFCTSTITVDAPATQILAQFNAGIVAYSQRLRQATAGKPLGAIVIDARADQGVAAAWPGFPWTTIAADYDVVMPMAYWSYFKPKGCPPQDASGYIHDVISLTESAMGTSKPIHPIGGVADCLSLQDVTTYVDAAKAAGSIGGSLFSLRVLVANPAQAAFWAGLDRLNG